MRKKKALSYENKLLNILKEKKSEEIDEDKSFLLSLVPSFKKMTDERKTDAKMEILSVIKRITQPRQASSIIHPTHNFVLGIQYYLNLVQNTSNYFPQNSCQQMFNTQAGFQGIASISRPYMPTLSVRTQSSISTGPTSPQLELVELI
jgi:hypothetical protein